MTSISGEIEMRNPRLVRYRASIIVLVLALFFVASSALSQQDLRTLKTKVADTLARFPAQSAEERNQLASEIIQLGSAGIKEICRMLVPPGTGDDTPVQFALNGVAVYVNRGSAEEEREMFALTLIESLGETQDDEVKAFLIRQLQITGRAESVKPLSQFLMDEKLCEPATQALLAIDTPVSEKSLLKSLKKVSAGNRATIIKALGELRSRAAVKSIIKYTDSEDESLRQVALYALANIGDSRSEKILDSVSVTAPTYERIKAPSLYLLFAQRLAESGSHETCVRICRKMIENYTAPQESHIQSSALSILVSVLGENALDDLLAALHSPNKEFRWRALELANTIEGEEATAVWIRKMEDVSPEVQAEIIAMLGLRGDVTALPVVLKDLKSEEKLIRLAAIPAAAQLGELGVLEDLMRCLETDQEDETRVVKQALMGYSAARVIPRAVNLIDDMPPLGRVVLIEILAERAALEQVDVLFSETKSEHKGVRMAALAGLEPLVSESDLPRLIKLLVETNDSKEISLIQNAAVVSANKIPALELRADLFLGTLAAIEGAKRVDLFRPLSRIGGEEALQAVVQETKSEDEMIRDAAVLTLSEWPDLSAADELFAICQSTENTKHIQMSIQGYVRLVNDSDLDDWKKFAMLKEALKIQMEAEEKKIVLAGLGNVKIRSSLNLVAPFLDDPELKAEAAIAAFSIVSPRRGENIGLTGPDVITVLKKAIESIEDAYDKERLERHLETLLKQEGFVPLFNGKDLSGWKGLVKDPPSRAKMTPEELEKAQAEADEDMRAHWKAVNGVLVFDSKGHSLCTARDYKDFEMFVDWKIEKGGDSGIYLRGSPQVQIWDTAQWPEGSGGLYNNTKGPNKPLAVADYPIGEWNSFRIKMVGEQVTVYLNNVLVVDNVVMENYWERDKPIYQTGQIELQAHSTPLYFRNIYIREITPDEKPRIVSDEEIAEGFVPLFNGEDLTGWVGDTAGYVAEERKIVIYPKRGSGNLYTEKEYNDFVLRFEFKLTPGANNGLGIRAPLEGDAAYVGMELQILDNTALIYKDLKPYQYHGSIYGVVPAKRGYQNPVGEWNEQEVIAKGTRITVILNGVAILDADIQEAIEQGTIDGSEHPGLKRAAGHIGFLGHGSHVEFRNIRIKELK
jgi:HEAT repeat protein